MSRTISIKKWVNSHIWVWSLLASVGIWLLICIIKHGFRLEYLTSNIYLSCFLILMVFAQTIVITTGEGAIDLSIFNVVSLSPYLIQYLTILTGSFAAGLLLTVMGCALIGMFNAAINYYMRVPAMIATLATGYIVYSLTIVLSSKVGGIPYPLFKQIAVTGKFLGVHVRIWFMLAAAACMYFLLFRTKYGWNLHAIGQNRLAAKYSGINVFRTVLISFALSSVIAGVSGLLLNGYLGLAGQDTGDPYMLPVLAATVIGGTNIDGGRASIIGGIFAGIMWTMLNAILNVSGLNTSVKSLLQGVALLIVLVAAIPRKQINK